MEILILLLKQKEISRLINIIRLRMWQSLLGKGSKQALGSKKGIERYGFVLPMDDCLAQVALDFGGRPWLVWDVNFTCEKIGEIPRNVLSFL